MSSIVIPCVCILICYARIFFFAKKSRTRVAAHSQKKRDMNSSLRLVKSLFASFMLFTVCWLPYGLIVMLDFADKLPPSAVGFSMTIAHLNSSLNPILYAKFNLEFRKGCFNMFKLLKLRYQSQPSAESSRNIISGSRTGLKTFAAKTARTDFSTIVRTNQTF
jgi:hypothetical protein